MGLRLEARKWRGEADKAFGSLSSSLSSSADNFIRNQVAKLSQELIDPNDDSNSNTNSNTNSSSSNNDNDTVRKRQVQHNSRVSKSQWRLLILILILILALTLTLTLILILILIRLIMERIDSARTINPRLLSYKKNKANTNTNTNDNIPNYPLLIHSCLMLSMATYR
jgi:hypothetical protein